MIDRKPRIAIVGAGVGGLTLCLALRQRDLSADIYEQTHELAEIGAAVALSANATRELGRLGVLDRIVAASTEPTELVYRNGRTGRRIAAHAVRLGGAYRARFGAPYCGIHRADLQRALGAGVEGERLRLGRRVVDLCESSGAVTLSFADGGSVEADAVIGADGVRSVARRFVAGDDGLLYSRTSGFRGIVPVAKLPSLPDPQAIQFWMGPSAHLLHYAIGADGGHVNFLAVVEGPRDWAYPEKGLAASTDAEALALFQGWHPAVTEMIAAVRHELRWGLFLARPLRRWRRGRVVLLGDAAHAMLPHHGQGANTTIEDAITLAELIAADPRDLDGAFAAYETLRRPRTRAIQRASWTGNRGLHLPDGPEVARRDALIARFPEKFGWIHAFDALEATRAAVRKAGGPVPV
jgi:2-polyprenyl-6-methoxyphenol hydroxylase-like FAD-dependent oxidoreductase